MPKKKTKPKHFSEVSRGLAQYVQKWDGFEKLVASMHEDGDVQVKRGERLKGKTMSWNIDVVIRTTRPDGTVKLTIAECKFNSTKPVGVDRVTHLHAVQQDVEADDAILFTTCGFQKGAEVYAKSKGMRLYRVADMPTDVWGDLGQIVRMYLVQYRFAVGPLQFGFLPPGVNVPNTRALNTPSEMLPACIQHIDAMRTALYDLMQGRDLILPGDGTYYERFPVRANWKSPVSYTESGDTKVVVGFETVFIVEVRMEKIEYDRANGFDYALIVEEMIETSRRLAIRLKGSSTSMFADELPPPVPMGSGETFQEWSWVHYLDSRFDKPERLAARLALQESHGRLMGHGREDWYSEGLPEDWKVLKWLSREDDPDQAMWAKSDVLDPSQLKS